MAMTDNEQEQDGTQDASRRSASGGGGSYGGASEVDADRGANGPTDGEPVAGCGEALADSCLQRAARILAIGAVRLARKRMMEANKHEPVCRTAR